MSGQEWDIKHFWQSANTIFLATSSCPALTRSTNLQKDSFTHRPLHDESLTNRQSLQDVGTASIYSDRNTLLSSGNWGSKPRGSIIFASVFIIYMHTVQKAARLIYERFAASSKAEYRLISASRREPEQSLKARLSGLRVHGEARRFHVPDSLFWRYILHQVLFVVLQILCFSTF